MKTPTWLLSFALCLPLALSSSLPQVAHAERGAEPAALQHGVYKRTAYPRRGASMQQVRKRFGKPQSVKVSQGKVKRKWPKITTWNYGTYTVYFERNRVLHTVIH